MSHTSGPLPQSLKDGKLSSRCRSNTLTLPTEGVHELCRMKSDLTGVNLSRFQKHKSPWYTCDSLPTWYSAEYEIRFVVGAAANVEAELWFKDQKYNEASAFSIDWDEGASKSAPQELPVELGNNYDRYR